MGCAGARAILASRFARACHKKFHRDCTDASEEWDTGRSRTPQRFADGRVDPVNYCDADTDTNTVAVAVPPLPSVIA